MGEPWGEEHLQAFALPSLGLAEEESVSKLTSLVRILFSVVESPRASVSWRLLLGSRAHPLLPGLWCSPEPVPGMVIGLGRLEREPLVFAEVAS